MHDPDTESNEEHAASSEYDGLNVYRCLSTWLTGNADCHQEVCETVLEHYIRACADQTHPYHTEYCAASEEVEYTDTLVYEHYRPSPTSLASKFARYRGQKPLREALAFPDYTPLPYVFEIISIALDLCLWVIYPDGKRSLKTSRQDGDAISLHLFEIPGGPDGYSTYVGPRGCSVRMENAGPRLELTGVLTNPLDSTGVAKKEIVHRVQKALHTLGAMLKASHIDRPQSSCSSFSTDAKHHIGAERNSATGTEIDAQRSALAQEFDKWIAIQRLTEKLEPQDHGNVHELFQHLLNPGSLATFTTHLGCGPSKIQLADGANKSSEVLRERTTSPPYFEIFREEYAIVTASAPISRVNSPGQIADLSGNHSIEEPTDSPEDVKHGGRQVRATAPEFAPRGITVTGLEGFQGQGQERSDQKDRKAHKARRTDSKRKRVASELDSSDPRSGEQPCQQRLDSRETNSSKNNRNGKQPQESCSIEKSVPSWIQTSKDPASSQPFRALPEDFSSTTVEGLDDFYRILENSVVWEGQDESGHPGQHGPARDLTSKPEASRQARSDQYACVLSPPSPTVVQPQTRPASIPPAPAGKAIDLGPQVSKYEQYGDNLNNVFANNRLASQPCETTRSRHLWSGKTFADGLDPRTAPRSGAGTNPLSWGSPDAMQPAFCREGFTEALQQPAPVQLPQIESMAQQVFTMPTPDVPAEKCCVTGGLPTPLPGWNAGEGGFRPTLGPQLAPTYGHEAMQGPTESLLQSRERVQLQLEQKAQTQRQQQALAGQTGFGMYDQPTSNPFVWQWDVQYGFPIGPTTYGGQQWLPQQQAYLNQPPASSYGGPPQPMLPSLSSHNPAFYHCSFVPQPECHGNDGQGCPPPSRGKSGRGRGSGSGGGRGGYGRGEVARQRGTYFSDGNGYEYPVESFMKRSQGGVSFGAPR